MPWTIQTCIFFDEKAVQQLLIEMVGVEIQEQSSQIQLQPGLSPSAEMAHTGKTKPCLKSLMRF